MKKKKDQLLGGSDSAGSEIPERGGFQHTPGPWHYQENSDAYTHIVRDGADRYVCGCSQDSGGNAEFNARLIAATPELLAATKRAYQAFSNILEFRIIKDPDKRETVRDLMEQLARALQATRRRPVNSSAPAAQSGSNDEKPNIFEKYQILRASQNQSGSNKKG